MTAEVRRCELADEAATQALGIGLARARPDQPVSAVIYLEGELGAGKSTLARALLRALGVTGTIRSPTYSLVERYRLPAGGEAVHMDLFRIAEPGELEFLALDELAVGAALWLIEWPERGGHALFPADLTVALAQSHSGSGRDAGLTAGSPLGDAWLRRLASSDNGDT